MVTFARRASRCDGTAEQQYRAYATLPDYYISIVAKRCLQRRQSGMTRSSIRQYAGE